MPEIPVKVYVRVRPLLAKELLESNDVCLQILDSQQLILGENRPFRFDRIFPQGSTQTQVYNDSVRPLVGVCLDGYNATVLAYGQTGSGKSYTMGSGNSLQTFSSENRGIIPRALEELFELVQLKKTEFQYQVSVSYLEIYKEELRDLLWAKMKEGHHELHIREDEQGNTVVVGCSEQTVETSEDALGWLGFGNSARITGATQMNQQSSRSHAIFTVHIRSWKRDSSGHADSGEDAEQCDEIRSGDTYAASSIFSHFHFVDLAGSERASKTGNQGERFKESIHINTGLLALGNVISALGDGKKKSQHVPYRDSKITRLLKDSLGGNSETVLITCLGPSVYNFAENLNSLKYAKRARNIQNRPIVNRNLEGSKLQQMKKEIILLKEELATAKWEAGKIASERTTGASLALSGLEKDIAEAIRDESGSRNLQHELTHASATLDVYSRCFKTVKDILVGIVQNQPGGSQGAVPGDEGGELAGQEKRNNIWLAKCLELLEACEAQGNKGGREELDRLISGAIASPSHEIVSSLHSELEECQNNLKKGRLAFEEKAEELAELKSTCQTLLEEKERVEVLWMASQNSEARIADQLQQLEEKMALLEEERNNKSMEEISEVDGEKSLKIVEDEVSANGAEWQEFKKEMDEEIDEDRTSLLMEDSLEEEDERSEVNGDLLSSIDFRRMERQKFEATRSLILGKVQAKRLSDFSEESVLKSLRILTHCITVNSASSLPPFSNTQNLDGSFNYSDLHEHRQPPDSVLVTSQLEPSLSSTLDHQSNLSMCRKETGLAGGKSEMELLNESTLDFQQQLVQAEDELCHAHEELRCLTMKIRLKEQLIRELGKNSRHVAKQNDSYIKRIQDLEQEATEVQEDMRRIQSALQSRGSNTSATSNRENVEKNTRTQYKEEQRKKLAQTQRRLSALQKRQKETQHLASYAIRSEKRIEELESGVERLRNQQEMLRRKLKKESEKKLKLEVDMQKYQHRIRTLQTRSEQQTKVLRVKTEEVAVAQRKLRSLGKKQLQSKADFDSPSESQLMKKTAWLEEEINQVLKEKQAITALEKELQEREKVVNEREKLVAERNHLEYKMVESSRAVSRQLETVSVDIHKVESSLKQSQEFSRGGAVVGHGKQAWKYGKEEVEKLIRERERLVKNQRELNAQLGNADNDFLTQEEQNMLVVLNEQVEVMDAALEFKNHSIALRNAVIKKDSESSGLVHSSENTSIKGKLSSLSQDDLCEIFEQWFNKVLQLRLQKMAAEHDLRALEVELEEERETRRKAELALHQARLDTDTLVTSQQLEHHREIEFLLQHTSSDQQDTRMIALKESAKKLEKDLYYYKTTCQSLWRKLQQLSGTERTNILHRGMTGSKEFSGSMPELTMADQDVASGSVASKVEKTERGRHFRRDAAEGKIEKRGDVAVRGSKSTKPIRGDKSEDLGECVDRRHRVKNIKKKRKDAAMGGLAVDTEVEQHSPQVSVVNQEAFKQHPVRVKKSLSELRLLSAEDLAKRS